MPVRKKKKDRSVGIIIFCRFPRSVKYLLLKHKNGHWAFAKGHPEKGEKKIETALREAHEETGIKKLTLLSNKILLDENYSFNKNGSLRIEKYVEYFIAESKKTKIKIDGKEITNFKWCTLKTAQKTLTFSQSYRVLKNAEKYIEKLN
ncbi:NUDIX domain-containing protein [soil metagenome]